VHLITRISIIGISVVTAALIILIAAFNGIEKMIENLYSEFDSDIIVTPSSGKTFNSDALPFSKLSKIGSIKTTSKVIDEIVVLRHEKKWVNARIYGVEEQFLAMSNAENHLVDGVASFNENNLSLGLIGAQLLDKLEGYIPNRTGHESLLCYAPKRNIKISPTSNPFTTQTIHLAGRLNYNNEINQNLLLVPIAFAKELLGYGNEITALYINLKSKRHLEDTKFEIQQLLGKEYVVKTHLEKNEIIYKTSKSEKLILIAILVFVFLLAAVNIVASLTMIYIEKRKNILTLQAFGANESFIFKIFYYEGLLIAFKGITIGFIIGLFVCFVQYYFELIVLPNTIDQAFPIAFSFMDGFLIFILVSMLSFITSYFPVKYLVFKSRIKRIDASIQ
jgi:lipoprotein-releasing system permease protein